MYLQPSKSVIQYIVDAVKRCFQVVKKMNNCDALDAQKLKLPKQRNDYFNISKKIITDDVVYNLGVEAAVPYTASLLGNYHTG